MRLVPTSLIVATVLAVAACTAPNSTTNAKTLPASSRSTSAPAASPSAARPTVAQITAWVNAAKLSASVVGASKPVNDVPGAAAIYQVCNTDIGADQEVLYAHYWRWVGRKLPYVEHGVYGYPHPASEVVTEIQSRANSCSSYDVKDPSGTGRLQFIGADTFKALRGIDGSYAFCEKSTTLAPATAKGEVAYICTAAVSRGNVLANVRVFGAKSTLVSAHAALTKVLPLVEGALIQAVPAP